jgi:hypothetical protein
MLLPYRRMLLFPPATFIVPLVRITAAAAAAMLPLSLRPRNCTLIPALHDVAFRIDVITTQAAASHITSSAGRSAVGHAPEAWPRTVQLQRSACCDDGCDDDYVAAAAAAAAAADHEDDGVG